jgi:mRNA interferase RelE/StbE
MKTVVYSKDAVKSLRRLPPATAARVRDKITQYAMTPEALANNVKALQGSDYYRLRVGDWRIIFSETADSISVLVIAPRGSVYR